MCFVQIRFSSSVSGAYRTWKFENIDDFNAGWGFLKLSRAKARQKFPLLCLAFEQLRQNRPKRPVYRLRLETDGHPERSASRIPGGTGRLKPLLRLTVDKSSGDKS